MSMFFMLICAFIAIALVIAVIVIMKGRDGE